ncbi:MAG: fructosamine kinase family protein [Apilactobacillus sp.]|uniref:fructosamine kinase family protein n=1 Tax=Apilactobacillus sp. TaxID=2767901 RepID=UPI0025E6B49D|nr:fructosamine kinase family protein [Apilactobacillus sp.]MCT6822450.1 fructosamine kinase family protein [Apilactobacillus sp.]
MSRLSSEWLKNLPFQNVSEISSVSGGDINEAYSIVADNKEYFMKVQPNKGKQFFEHEVEGINKLSERCLTPQIVTYGEIDGDGYLIQNWLDLSHIGDQNKLGKLLANVHHEIGPNFGLNHNFDLGKIPKNNHWQDSWSSFFIDQRLAPLIQRAIDQGLINNNELDKFNNVINSFKIDMKSHKSVPSLLHGDLWSGNFSFVNGEPILIDPDVFYGDREFDIGVSTVFGGFNSEFYESYNQNFPLDEGWQHRIKYYQLYYLTAHLVMFGQMYLPSVISILDQF